MLIRSSSEHATGRVRQHDCEGDYSGFPDFRMVNYCEHQLKIPRPSAVIPETSFSSAEYKAKILRPMYREIAALDPEGMLQHEWLNARGEIPRLDRRAIESRVIDTQECTWADFCHRRCRHQYRAWALQ